MRGTKADLAEELKSRIEEPRKKPPKHASLRIRTATPSSVRAVNRSIILGLIRRHQPISRADLARMTGFFRSSVSDIVDECIAAELVVEERATPSRRGRVPMSLRLNDSGYLVLGINIRPRHCQIGCAGLSGRLQNIWTFETPSLPEQLVDAIDKTITAIRRELKLRTSDFFRRIGISIPGHVDATSGRILWTPTHPELAGFPIADRIRSQTGVSVLADNDCNVGALSELWLRTGEKLTRTTDFVFLNVSDFGVGSGAVLNGQLYLGHDAHFAGEFGHMVIEPSGKSCRCGRRGCWELYVSNEATWNRYRPRTPFTSERFDQMLSSAQTGDETAMKSLMQTARYISLGISNIGFALNPAEVVVAGRIARVWDRIRRIVETAYGSPQLKYAVRPSSLSADDSLLHGAICLALRDDFAAPKFGAA